MSAFPPTSATLIAKIRELADGDDSAVWVRFWNSYQGVLHQFAVMKGGEERADDIVMTVLGKLVEVLRTGQYTQEKGRFRSYLAMMVVNEIRMAHRKDTSRKRDRHISIDTPIGDSDEATIADTLPAPTATENYDDEWRQAVLESARRQVLTHTALSERDRQIYRAYAIDGEDIAVVARRFGISRNLVSQIKTRIDRRIVLAGQALIRDEEELFSHG